MAKLPPKKEEGNSQEWLNTYADMVTLLLTFFVLLFASSNLDESKMQFIVQAFQNRGKFINTVVAQPNDQTAVDQGGITDDAPDGAGEGTMPQSFEELYQYLAEYIDSNSLGDSVSIENSAAYFTLRFNSSVFFEPNQSILKAEGKDMLMQFSPYIKALEDHIQTLTVTGHTALDTSSSAISDWTLSSGRASSVTNYLETGMGDSVIDNQKYRTRGCGNTEPMASNDTAEGRQQNRRVELVMLKKVDDPMSPEVIKDILEHDYGIKADDFDPNNPNDGQDYETLPDGSIDKIIGYIEDKFKDDGSMGTGTMGPGAVDGSLFIAAAESSEESGSAESAEES
ncbi:MAG: OmpA family protein [Lachnospiraceae bacterium]|nr:OmpA family protein [Ruminococcus sp.]MCM1273843.1 OmpA family protein [Lachnospiraceae bacterium]